MLGITDYLWRLLPANPILLRVVEAAGRRKRDLVIRCLYLGLLVFYVVFALLSERSTSSPSLSDLSNASRSIFRQMSYLQLGLVALLAPIFTAGAITQEKDSQTYDILLATPLTNGQIVLGSLMSRLFFVIALLLSGIPIFSVTQIFGGVAIGSITLSCLIAASTACVTGALAMAIATFKVGTRRTIFSFYLFIVICLVGLWLLDKLPLFQVAGPRVPGGAATAHISWFTGIHPFLALQVLLGDPEYQPPPPGLLPPSARFWPANWYLTDPTGFYITFTFALSLLLVVPAIVLLRRMAQSSTTLQNWFLQKLRIIKGDRTRKPRSVWSNPIAWREAKTKASAARASLLRWSFITAGVVGALVLAIAFATPQALPPKYISPGGFDAATHTLFVHGDGTYGVTPDAQITLDPEAGGDPKNVSDELLNDRYGVADFQTKLGPHSTKEITAIHLTPIRSSVSAAQVRTLLLGAIVLEFAVILLIVTNAAASTVTREKEDGSLDLLLSTPITSRSYIWGKLRGLVSFVLPLVAVPVASVMIFVLFDSFRSLGSRDFDWIVLPEAAIIMPPILIIMTAFASIVGMNLSLRCRTTVRAVMSSIGVVAGLCAVLVGCGQAILNIRSSDGLHLLFAGFSPFTLLMILVDPYTLASNVFGAGRDTGSARAYLIASALVATGVYAGLVWAMYSSMVKNFDMTIRRQSR